MPIPLIVPFVAAFAGGLAGYFVSSNRSNELHEQLNDLGEEVARLKHRKKGVCARLAKARKRFAKAQGTTKAAK